MTTNAKHIIRIKHDAESHALDCHDECEAEVICNGVTDYCRTWWECSDCARAIDGFDELERDEYDEALWRDGEAHGVEHQYIEGMWMAPGVACIARTVEHNGGDLIHDLPDGDHAVEVDYEDGFVYVTAIREAVQR